MQTQPSDTPNSRKDKILSWLDIRSIRARITLSVSFVGLILLVSMILLIWRLSAILNNNTSLSTNYQPVKIYAFATSQSLNQLVANLHSNVYTSEQKVSLSVNNELKDLWESRTLLYFDSLSNVIERRNEPELQVLYEALNDRMDKLKKIIPQAIAYNTEDNRRFIGKFYVDSLQRSQALIAYNEELAYLLSNDISKIQSEVNQYSDQLIAFNNRAMASTQKRLSNEYKNFGIYEVFTFVATVILLALVAFWLIRFMLRDVNKIKVYTSELASGNIPPATYTQSRELNAIARNLNEVSKNLNLLRKFADNVGKGDFDEELKAFSGQGNFGGAIQNMREGLLKVSQEDDIRSWKNEGFAKFNDILRRESGNLEKLSDELISNLVKYIDANQGGIFIVNDETPNGETFLELASCYAYNKKKYIEKRIEKGQSLIGRAWREGLPIYMTNVPNGYIEIRTGLGGANPRYLFIVPLKINKEVLGVLEIASFKDILPYQKEFIEEIAENIASTFQNTKVNRKTQLLLEESQRITSQMREQEEELRQNLEELQATQEEMQRNQREISEKEGNMRTLLDNASDAILAFDHQYKLLVINQSMKRLYEAMGIYLDVGNILEEPYPGRTWDETKEEFTKALSGERFTTYSEVKLKGETYYYEVLYNPMYNERQRVIGASLFITDVTQQKTVENNLKIKQANLDSLINNTEDSIVAMDKKYRLLVFNEVFKKRRRDFDFDEGSDALELIPEHIRDEWKKYYDRTLKGERFDKVIKRQVGKKTTYRQYSFNPIFDEQGEVIGLSVFSKDITESKLAEAENQKIIQNLFTKVRESQERINELEQLMQEKS